MEESQDTSENEMSFEFTGPAVVVPFTDGSLNRSWKRDFNSFSEDALFQPAEQHDRPVFVGSIAQNIPTTTGYGSELQRQPQLALWIQWGIFRSLEAIEFTSSLLQAVYAATVVAAMPVAAAKRRLVSFAREIPAPAPLHRMLPSRRTIPRIFRQNHSLSPGQRSTTPITPPRFKPSLPSPFHMPGRFPVSPPKPPTKLPAATTPSNFHDPLITNISSSAATSPSVLDGNSTLTDPVDDAISRESIAHDSMDLSDYEVMEDDVSPVKKWCEPVSPLRVMAAPPVLGAHQMATINELQAIQKMFKVDSPARSPRRPIISAAMATATAPNSPEFKELSESTKCSPNRLGKQLSPISNLIESTRSILEKSGQPRTEFDGLIESTRSPSNVSRQQPSAPSGLIQTMRSPPQVLGQRVSASSGLTESTQSSLQPSEQQPSDSDELIESTRSSSSLPGQQSPVTGGINGMPDSPPQISVQQSSAPSSSIAPTQFTPQISGQQCSEFDESIESTRSSSNVVGQQLPGDKGSIESRRSPSNNSTQQGKLNTILKTSKPSMPEKGLLSQLLSSLHRRKKMRASPLRETFNSANTMPKTPINKSARFLDNPVTRTRKYVKGEAISFPSAHSSKEGDSILSQTPSLVVSELSPTQQEQETLIAGQLMGSIPRLFTRTSEAGFSGSDIALDSSPLIKYEDSGSFHSETDEERESSQSSPAQDDTGNQVLVQPTEAENAEPLTTPMTLTNRFEELNVSGRRSSRRTQEKDYLAEKRRLEEEAIAAKERARREKAEAAEKARRAKEEAEEKARKEAEEEKERSKRTLRMPVGKVIQPLTEEWENKVAAALALAPTRTIAHTSRGTPITRRDIGKVLPQRGTADPANGWLNDAIIDAYLQAIVDHANEAAGHKRGETPKFHAFNNFFYNNLRDEGAEKVKRWGKRAKIGGKDLLKVEWVFMPVNVHGNHWTLIAVSPARKTIEYYDSFHGMVTNEIRNVKAWLKSELGSDYKDQEWKVLEDPEKPGMGKGPRQLNGSDCGMFTVTTAKMISLGVDPMAVSANDMPTQRKRLVAELIHGGFTDEFEPDIRFR